jgi:hypothetical protein
VNQILKAHPQAQVRVLAVWEPILLTDWRRPVSGALNRLADRRVAQFWDPQHLIAKRMAQDARSPQPEQHCCERDGNLWDLAAVYRSGANWEGSLPPAIVFDGPIVRKQDEITRALTP